MTEKTNERIKFQIVEKIGVLNSYPTGWRKEVNLVSWNDKPEKYDIRDWDPDHERMSRGVTLHTGEMKRLLELCAEYVVKDDAAGEQADGSAVQPDGTAAKPDGAAVKSDSSTAAAAL